MAKLIFYAKNSSLFLITYLFSVNLGGFLLMGVDKKKARNSEWRIPEKRLFGVAFFGGALGVLSGMYFYRHKTKHWSFKIGIPLLLCTNFIAIYYLLSNPFG